MKIGNCVFMYDLYVIYIDYRRVESHSALITVMTLQQNIFQKYTGNYNR